MQDVVARLEPVSDRIASMNSIGRSVILILANEMMMLNARHHDRKLWSDPLACPRSTVVSAIQDVQTLKASAAAADRGSKAVRFHMSCIQIACDLVAATMAATIEKTSKEAVASAWSSLWAARGNLRKGLAWLRGQERSLGAQVLHSKLNGTPATDEDVLSLAQAIPPFLRSAKAGS